MSVWVQICGNECHLVNHVLKLMLLEVRSYSKVTQNLFNNLSHIYIYISSGQSLSHVQLFATP